VREDPRDPAGSVAMALKVTGGQILAERAVKEAERTGCLLDQDAGFALNPADPALCEAALRVWAASDEAGGNVVDQHAAVDERQASTRVSGALEHVPREVFEAAALDVDVEFG